MESNYKASMTARVAMSMNSFKDARVSHLIIC